jgi:hypothetical protein
MLLCLKVYIFRVNVGGVSEGVADLLEYVIDADTPAAAAAAADSRSM